jgi:hypothetical protein
MSKHLRQYLHASLALAFLISIALVQSGLAAPSFQRRTPEPDEIRRGYHAHTGKLSFVGGDRGQPLLKMEEVGAQSAEAAGMAVIRRYAGQFGVQDPGRNLRLDRIQEEAVAVPPCATSSSTAACRWWAARWSSTPMRPAMCFLSMERCRPTWRCLRSPLRSLPKRRARLPWQGHAGMAWYCS